MKSLLHAFSEHLIAPPVPVTIFPRFKGEHYLKGKARNRNPLEQQIFALKKTIKRREANKRGRKARRHNRN